MTNSAPFIHGYLTLDEARDSITDLVCKVQLRLNQLNSFLDQLHFSEWTNQRYRF